MTILAVFRSRAQSLDFLARVKAAGVSAQAVSTPKEAGVGCGVSVKFEEAFYPKARRVLAGRQYSAFAGFMKNSGGGFFYERP